MEKSESKVCLICFWDRNATPYLEKYERILTKNCVKYDVLLWNRDNSHYVAKKNEYVYENKISKRRSIKLIQFLLWKRYVRGFLKKKQYDMLIVLSTHPGILLSRYLRNVYRNRYVFDIRDYTMERIRPFQRLVMKLINDSLFTSISSKGFMEWLDQNEKICINHNITDKRGLLTPKKPINNREKVNIGFVGTIRFTDENLKLAEGIKRYPKYKLVYIGRPIPGNDLEKISKQKRLTNMHFEGGFSSDQKSNIYSNIDLINSIYGNKSCAVKTALPNRLYDAAVFKIPIIASSGTYLSDIVAQFDLGIGIDLNDENFAEKINDYIRDFDRQKFENGCKSFLAQVEDEDDIFLKKFEEILIDMGDAN